MIGMLVNSFVTNKGLNNMHASNGGDFLTELYNEQPDFLKLHIERKKLEEQKEALMKSCETSGKKMSKLAGEYKATQLKRGFVEAQLGVINRYAKISSSTPTSMDTNL